MAAVTTGDGQNLSPDSPTQVTFPSDYASVYNARQPRLRVASFNTQRTHYPPFVADNDDQMVHEQRRRDAHYMANAQVQSRHNMNKRALVAKAGYYGMPEPVLTQRVYANPSSGAYTSVYSARNDGSVPAPFGNMSDGLSGGVLRSAEGQAYGKKVLMDRVKQFDDIALAKQNFQFLGPPTSSATAEERAAHQTESLPTAASSSKIELNLLLQSVLDSLTSGSSGEHLTRFTYSDASRALSLIFRFASTLSADDLLDIKAQVDAIVEDLNTLVNPDDAEPEQPISNTQIGLSLQVLFTRLEEYLDRMIGAVDKSEEERVTLSKNLVKSLGFDKALRLGKQNLDSMLKVEAREHLLTAQQHAVWKDTEDDEGDDDSFRFDSSAVPREDDEQPFIPRGDRSGFDVDNRQIFGATSGSYFRTGGRDIGYFDEEDGVEDLATSTTQGIANTIREAIQVPNTRRIAPASVADTVTSRFDPDTQAFNVSMPKRATRVRDIYSIPTSIDTSRASSYMKKDILIQSIPKSRAELPTTREGFDALARKINEEAKAAGLPPQIVVYSGSQPKNIRANFIRKFKL